MTTRLQQHLIGEVKAGLLAMERTQAWLAGEIGMSQKFISQMLTGRASGSIASWENMLAAVGRTGVPPVEGPAAVNEALEEAATRRAEQVEGQVVAQLRLPFAVRGLGELSAGLEAVYGPELRMLAPAKKWLLVALPTATELEHADG